VVPVPVVVGIGLLPVVVGLGLVGELAGRVVVPVWIVVTVCVVVTGADVTVGAGAGAGAAGSVVLGAAEALEDEAVFVAGLRCGLAALWRLRWRALEAGSPLVFVLVEDVVAAAAGAALVLVCEEELEEPHAATATATATPSAPAMAKSNSRFIRETPFVRARRFPRVQTCEAPDPLGSRPLGPVHCPRSAWRCLSGTD
jgi:hypothetical protein